MNVLDAAYITGKQYPGGTEALALRIGHPNLSDELNPNRPSAKLGLQTAVDIQLLSKDYRVLYAMALELGHFPPLPMPEAGAEPVAKCLKSLGVVAQDFSKLVAEVTNDLSDNEVTPNEFRRIERAWNTLMVHGQSLLTQLAAMRDAGLRGHQ